ncbi:MAG: NYN domain-containing protein [Treponema sp.]|nr:NYN domain-containing protein [Treponema sp.]MCR5046223.1 NYN domain-containing protein [Treponema sp.]
METSEKSIAVLIDADNTPGKKLRVILQAIAVHGHIITKRAYGDFSSEHLKNWKRDLNDNAIIPIQQFAYTQGKNSSDSAMIIDAMDLLYTDKYDSIALVTSDSDFTKLATRLRESQIFVFGVGQKKTPPSFVNACDNFIYIENLNEEDDDDDDNEEKADEAKQKVHKVSKVRNAFFRKSPGDKMTDRQFRKIFKLLSNAYENYAGDDGWAEVSAAGNFFKRQDPGFDTLDYGFKKLSDLILYLKDDFELQKIPSERNSRHVRMQYRPK